MKFPRLIAAAFFPLVISAPAAEPFLEKVDLSTQGDLGYQPLHIPGIVVTAKGSILAWCEAREDGGDWDQIDILLRRSIDRGPIQSRLADPPLRMWVDSSAQSRLIPVND